MEETFLQSHLLDLGVLVVGIAISILLFLKYRSSKYVSFLTYIPNVWTSLGILGTFVSIYISLNQFDFKSVIDVGLLVKMIAPAFSTSIIGIIGALAFSMIIRFIRATEEMKVETAYVSTIKNIERQVNTLGAGAKEIARDMGREMVEAAGEGLRDSLRQHIKAMATAMEKEEKKFEELTESVTANLQKVSDEHNEAMKKLCLQYKSEAEHIRKECEEFLVETKERTCRDVASISSEHARQVEVIAQMQIEHLNTIDETIKDSVERSYVALSDQVRSTVSEMEKVTGTLDTTRTGFQEISRSIADAGESFEKVKDSLESSRDELDKVVEDCSRRMIQMTTNLTNTIHKEAENAAAVQSLLQQADVVIRNLEKTTLKMGSVISNRVPKPALKDKVTNLFAKKN